MRRNHRVRVFYGLVAIGLVLSPVANSQDIYVYPSDGQSDEQLAEDRYACHTWAVKESGFDPSLFKGVAPLRTVKVPVPPNEAEGAAAKGAIAGAVAGGIVGSRGHDTAEGVVIGAVLGTLAGSAIEEQGQQEAKAKAEAEARQEAEEIAKNKTELALRKSNYQRALTACLEGRGYTVR